MSKLHSDYINYNKRNRMRTPKALSPRLQQQLLWVCILIKQLCVSIEVDNLFKLALLCNIININNSALNSRWSYICGGYTSLKLSLWSCNYTFIHFKYLSDMFLENDLVFMKKYYQNRQLKVEQFQITFLNLSMYLVCYHVCQHNQKSKIRNK